MYWRVTIDSPGPLLVSSLKLFSDAHCKNLVSQEANTARTFCSSCGEVPTKSRDGRHYIGLKLVKPEYIACVQILGAVQQNPPNLGAVQQNPPNITTQSLHSSGLALQTSKDGARWTTRFKHTTGNPCSVDGADWQAVISELKKAPRCVVNLILPGKFSSTPGLGDDANSLTSYTSLGFTCCDCNGRVEWDDFITSQRGSFTFVNAKSSCADRGLMVCTREQLTAAQGWELDSVPNGRLLWTADSCKSYYEPAKGLPPTATIKNCTFIGNRARYAGGAVAVSNGNVSIIDSHFEGNSAASGGGITAGSSTGTDQAVNLEISQTRFVHNSLLSTAGTMYLKGGAALMLNGKLTNVAIDHSSFQKNYIPYGAGMSGSGILVNGGGSLQLSRSFLSENWGAVQLNSEENSARSTTAALTIRSGSARLANVNFTLNNAQGRSTQLFRKAHDARTDWCASTSKDQLEPVFLTGPCVNPDHSTFSLPEGQPGSDAKGYCSLLKNASLAHEASCGPLGSLFLQYTPTWQLANGGAISIDSDGSLQCKACHFYGQMGVLGGAVFSASKSLSLVSSSFTNNTAQQGGGALFIRHGTASINSQAHITASEFHGNVAGSDGGAVLSEYNTQTRVFNSHLIGNRAVRGGALVSTGGLEVSGSEFSQNLATTGGAVQVAAQSTFPQSASIYDTQFVSNAAIESGALELAAGTSVNMIRVNFTSNQARRAGAIVARGRLSLHGSVFKSNKGVLGGSFSPTGAIELASSSTVSITETLFDRNESPLTPGALLVEV